MNLQKLLDGGSPASAADITALSQWSPASLPAEYIALLQAIDGGDATRSEYPTYIRIWPASRVIEYNCDYQVQRWVPGLVAFGDDGGEVIVAFDTRSGPPFAVLVVPFVPMEFESAEIIAADFGEFLAQFVFRDTDG